MLSSNRSLIVPMPTAQAPQLENTFRGANGLSLFYQAWYPPGTVRAIVAIVHGFGEHCDR